MNGPQEESHGLTLDYGWQAYAVAGPVDDGPRRSFLLVHGWGGDGRAWTPLVPGLAENHRVLAVDVRGHGRSSVPTGGAPAFGSEAIAADLAAVLEHTGAGPTVAVGHSWGGQLVTALAVTRPDLLTGIVVLDPAYGDDSPERLAVLRDRWYSAEAPAALAAFAESAFRPHTPDDVRRAVLAGFRGTDTRVLADAFVAMYLNPHAFGLRPATEAYLRRVTVPTLAVYADPDAAGWAAGLPQPPGSRVVAWPGAGHYLHLERPEASVSLIREWVDGIATD